MQCSAVHQTDYCLIFPRPNIQTNLSFIIFKSILLEQFWSHYMFRRYCPVHVCCITEGCLQIIMSSQQKFNWSLIPIVPSHKSSATSLRLPIHLVTNLSCCPHAKPLPPACTTRFPGCHLLPAQTHLPQGCSWLPRHPLPALQSARWPQCLL